MNGGAAKGLPAALIKVTFLEESPNVVRTLPPYGERRGLKHIREGPSASLGHLRIVKFVKHKSLQHH